MASKYILLKHNKINVILYCMCLFRRQCQFYSSTQVLISQYIVKKYERNCTYFKPRITLLPDYNIKCHDSADKRYGSSSVL
jgi:hypothetical protein